MKIRWILGLLIVCLLSVINVRTLVAEKTWMQRADMPTARYNFDTCVVDGKVFAIGGEIDVFGERSIATVEVYDPKTDTWERKADMPTARSGVETLVVDGKIYAIGGAEREKIPVGPGWGNRRKSLPIVEMYDPITDTWVQKADMPVWRDGGTCVVDGKIYIIGGVAGNREEWRLDIVDVYDPATDTWAKAKNMRRSYQLPVNSFQLKKELDTSDYPLNWVLVTGYWLLSHMYLSTVEVYDPETDRWIQEPDMPLGKSGHEAEVINGNIYIFGGSAAGVWAPLTDVEVYGTDELPQSVDPVGKLVKTWGAIKTRQ